MSKVYVGFLFVAGEMARNRSPSPPILRREGPSPYTEREGRYPDLRGEAGSSTVDEATLLRQQQQALAWQQQQMQTSGSWGGPGEQGPWQQWGPNFWQPQFQYGWPGQNRPIPAAAGAPEQLPPLPVMPAPVLPPLPPSDSAAANDVQSPAPVVEEGEIMAEEEEEDIDTVTRIIAETTFEERIHWVGDILGEELPTVSKKSSNFVRSVAEGQEKAYKRLPPSKKFADKFEEFAAEVAAAEGSHRAKSSTVRMPYEVQGSIWRPTGRQIRPNLSSGEYKQSLHRHGANYNI